ncbi:MAG: mycothiol biosynthesis protein [Subtercola sp.]|nr:mycothiol biosynthesis protein [Subtercola sp.]
MSLAESAPSGGPGEVRVSEFGVAEPPVGESWLVRVGSWVVALLLGVVFGMIGTVVNQATISVFGWFTLPIGLIMAILASILLLVGLRLILPTRTLALLAAIGLVGIVAALTLTSPGGSVLIPANVYGYIWTFAPTIVSLIVLAWPNRIARRTPAPGIHTPSAPAAEPVVPSE